MGKEIRKMRVNYQKHELRFSDLQTNPFSQFSTWFNDALNANCHEPNAFVLSTVNENGFPSSRMLLCKDFSEGGFVFYSNYQSRKAREIEQNPFAAMLFWWPKTERQVRIEGKIEKISFAQSDDYFNSRPYESRIAAIISKQSSVIPNDNTLEENFSFAISSLCPTDIKRPAHWGGYLLVPTAFEFWQGRANRLHNRFRYFLQDSKWNIERLSP